MRKAIPMWDNPDRQPPMRKAEEPPLSEEEQGWLESKVRAHRQKQEHWFRRGMRFVWAMFW